MFNLNVDILTMIFLLTNIFGLAVVIVVATPDHLRLQQQDLISESLKDPMLHDYLLEGLHQRRASSHFISDCMFVTSEAGYFIYKSSDDDPKVCGIYFLTDPDRRVELRFTFFDIPCERSGLVSFVDGWELNSELFPSPMDHPLSPEERVSEFCGKHARKVFISSQNAAVIQYRIPMRGKGFTVLVRYPKHLTPCNILADSTSDMFTLRNYGRRVNCTLSAMYPAAVRIIALAVGINNPRGMIHEAETGIVHKCNKRGLQDQVQIGGSNGLDSTNLEIFDSICGIDSKPENNGRVVGCEVTSVRLMSSGMFDNLVTVVMVPASENDILEANLVCGL